MSAAMSRWRSGPGRLVQIPSTSTAAVGVAANCLYHCLLLFVCMNGWVKGRKQILVCVDKMKLKICGMSVVIYMLEQSAHIPVILLK